MTEIKDLEEWTKEYFKQPEIQEKAAKACEHYDRLMVRQVKKQMMLGTQSINLQDIALDDPGKALEKAKYEIIPSILYQGQKGKLRINMLEQTAEFLKA